MSQDAWSVEFTRVKNLISDLAANDPPASPLHNQTVIRGRLRQIQHLIQQLERGILSTNPHVAQLSNRKERGEALIGLRNSFKKLERRLTGVSTTGDNSEEEGETMVSRNFAENQFDSRLDVLHASASNLKNIGKEISHEISDQVELLNSIENQNDGFLAKNDRLRSRLNKSVDENASLCLLYFIIILLAMAIFHIAIVF
jgi:uncharacterized Zn finger protein